MNREQVLKISEAVVGQWPAFKPTETVLSEWARVLVDVDFGDARKALDAYGIENKFAPNAYDLKKRIGVKGSKEGASPSQLERYRLGNEIQRNKGFEVLARNHPAGLAWSYVPAEQARRDGRATQMIFHGTLQTIFLED